MKTDDMEYYFKATQQDSNKFEIQSMISNDNDDDDVGAKQVANERASISDRFCIEDHESVLNHIGGLT